MTETTRRQVLRGAAWAVPVVAVAVATPLAAASTEPAETCLRFTNALPHLGSKNKTAFTTFELATECLGGVSGISVTVSVTGPKNQGSNEHVLYGEDKIVIDHIAQYMTSGSKTSAVFSQLHANMTYTFTFTATYVDSKGQTRSVIVAKQWTAPDKWATGWAE